MSLFSMPLMLFGKVFNSINIKRTEGLLIFIIFQNYDIDILVLYCVQWHDLNVIGALYHQHITYSPYLRVK